ncbi:PIN domain-containing protein [Actinomycetota bacterium]|nr:PIN domain-containing protein [Actinomycetota bacterium]
MELMLDNNIVIDKLCQREPFYKLSNKVCLLGLVGDANTHISVNMLSDIFYILRKDYGNMRAQEMILENLSYLKLCGVSADDGIASLRQEWDDFEDCLVARCAENVKADYIITRNPGDFKRSLVPALTPEELFELLKDRDGLWYEEIEL